MRCASVGDAPADVPNHKLSVVIREFIQFYGIAHMTVDLYSEWDQTVAMGCAMVGVPFTAIAPKLTEDNTALWSMADHAAIVPGYAHRYPMMLDRAELVLVCHRGWQGSGQTFEQLATARGLPVVNLWGKLV